jgi:hypothetical protein
MLADLEEHTVASLPDAGLTLVRTVGSGGFRCGAVVSTFQVSGLRVSQTWSSRLPRCAISSQCVATLRLKSSQPKMRPCEALASPHRRGATWCVVDAPNGDRDGVAPEISLRYLITQVVQKTLRRWSQQSQDGRIIRPIQNDYLSSALFFLVGLTLVGLTGRADAGRADIGRADRI